MDLYERAWSSSDSAAGYEWARPAYPDDAVEFLGEVLHIGPGSIVLDVGAGTGKLSRNVVRLGCKLIAIEPLPEMRDQFRDAVVGIDVLDGTAEALPVDVESVDAIVAGQAWHWFDSWAAVVEAERVLRPGGGVGLLGTSTTSRFAGLRTLRAWDVSQSFDRNPHLRENGVPRLTAGLGGQI